MRSEAHRSWPGIASSALAVAILSGGCIELQGLLQDVVTTPSNPFSDDTPDNSGPDAPEPTSGLPTVVLSVSNESPGLSETVVFTCTASGGDGTGLSYGFQPDDGTLSINAGAGTASFTVSEPDLGTEFSFTCTAANEFGTSDPSNRVTVIPVG